MPIAMRNLAVALARDRLRYAYIRGGSYRPKPKKYRVGDFVYVQRRVTDTVVERLSGDFANNVN